MKHKVLLGILFIALCLRFIGTNPGYNKFHSDEGITYSSAVSMIKNGNLDPLRYDYPALVPLINYIFFKTIFIPLGWMRYFIEHVPQIIDGTVHIPLTKLESARVFQSFVLGEREINALFWGRYVTALLSVGNVFLTYFLGKKLFSKKIGLIAAFLLAVSFKAVTNSHIGLPDTYNAFFLLLSLIFSYKLFSTPTSKNYLLAGIFVGLSISVKYQVFAVFPFLLAHFISSIVSKKINLFSWKMVLAGLAAALVFILVNPYLLIHLDKALPEIWYVGKKYAMGRSKLMTYPLYYLFQIDYGPPIFLLIIAGFFYSLKNSTKQTLFLLAHLTPFLFVMLYYSVGGFYVRNFITVTPILMIFAAVFIAFLSKKFNIFVTLFIIAAVAFIPFKNSLINSFQYTREWAYDEILTKSSKVLPTGSIIASHPFDPLPDTVKRTDFERAYSYSFPELKESKAEYALINMDWASHEFYGWMTEVLPKSSTYLQKPIQEMRNTFSGIAVEEMIPFIVASSYKPWQAPDAALFLVKIPYYENVKFLNPVNIDIKDVDTKNEFEVKPDFVYRVKGLVKSDKVVDKQKRSVFLRIDFFESSSTDQKRGIHTSVSQRYYGADWQKLELTTIAPKEAKFARISIQAYTGTSDGYVVKNVTIEESDTSHHGENYEQIDFSQYVDLLYPYSHGNL